MADNTNTNTKHTIHTIPTIPTKLVKFSNVDPDLWKAIRILADHKGETLSEVVNEALRQYVVNNQVEQVAIDIKIIENKEKNLLSYVYEEELKLLLTSLLEAKKRDAPIHFINDLKRQTLDLVKKHPQLSQPLADEVVQVFRVIA